MVTATIDGVTFSTDGTSGFTLDENALAGWYSGPPVRSNIEDRPNSNGAFGVVRVYKGARVITLTGLVLAADTATAMNDHWARFAAIQSDGAPSTLTVVDDSGTKTATVTLADVPEIIPGVNGVGDYTLQLVARDPVKYGITASLATGIPVAGGGLEFNLFGATGVLGFGANGYLGRVDLTNNGTAETWPTVTVSGELTNGFYIQCLDTGQRVRYDRIVPAGTTVTINFRTGSVLIDGISDGSTYLTEDNFFSLPKQTTRTVQFNPIGGSSGTPTATFTFSDGWW